jgi:hypothetical protein
MTRIRAVLPAELALGFPETYRFCRRGRLQNWPCLGGAFFLLAQGLITPARNP